MSFENEGKEEEEEEEDESDTLNDSDNIDSQQNGGGNNGRQIVSPFRLPGVLIQCSSGLVSHQTYQDNEMMKKLLLCSNNCQEDSNGAAHCDEDNEEDSDDADVIVESHQDNPHSLKSFCRQVETLENLNFNYDVIVKFVKQGRSINLGRLVSNDNYCRVETLDWLSVSAIRPLLECDSLHPAFLSVAVKTERALQ